MKTGMSIEIRAEDLTHKFVWNGKTIPIGRFDPSAYPEMAQEPIEDLGQEVYDQLEDSREMTDEEMSVIAELSVKEFNACILERK
jgi:hypothetical protein